MWACNMIDIGFSKILVVGIVAIVVIGPERLPATAKAIGIMWSRMQKYINKIKQEVSDNINLNSNVNEEIRSLVNIKNNISNEINEHFNAITSEINNMSSSMQTSVHVNYDNIQANMYKNNGRNSWRIKCSSTPLWYKHKNNIRAKVLGGSARMQKHTYKTIL
jgi:sec-independent protein translocase protein TatB